MEVVAAVQAFLAGVAGTTLSELAKVAGERLAARVRRIFFKTYGHAPPPEPGASTVVKQSAVRQRLTDLLRDDSTFRAEITALIAEVSNIKEHQKKLVMEPVPPLAPKNGNFSVTFGPVHAQNVMQIGKLAGGTVITGGTVFWGDNPEERAQRQATLAGLHLVDGRVRSGLSCALEALRADASNAYANYYAGVAPLTREVRGLDGQTAEACESRLAQASEDPALTGPCCYPRAALRYDHFRYHRKPEPPPDLQTLVALEGRYQETARIWPYFEINRRVGASLAFQRLWWGN